MIFISLKFPQIKHPVGTSGIPYSGILHTLAGSPPLQSAYPGSQVNPVCSLIRPARCRCYPAGLRGQFLPSGCFSVHWALLLMLGTAAISAGYCHIDWCHHPAAARHVRCHGQHCSSQYLQATLCLGRRLFPSHIMLCPQVSSWRCLGLTELSGHIIFVSSSPSLVHRHAAWARYTQILSASLTLRQHLSVHPIFH